MAEYNRARGVLRSGGRERGIERGEYRAQQGRQIPVHGCVEQRRERERVRERARENKRREAEFSVRVCEAEERARERERETDNKQGGRFPPAGE